MRAALGGSASGRAEAFARLSTLLRSEWMSRRGGRRASAQRSGDSRCAVARPRSDRDAWRVDFRILGPVEACVDGRPLPLGGVRQRALLALLLMHADESVSRDSLVDELWGGRAPATAVKTLHVQVSRLRRVLGGASAPLESTPGGYRLRVEPDELDLRRFERLCQEGRRAMDGGEF